MDSRLIVVGSIRPNIQLELLRRLQERPRVSFYILQSLVLGWLAEPFYWAQRWLYPPLPDQPDPVFIVGIWRSGTTYLHNELVAATDASSNLPQFSVCPQVTLILKRFMQWIIPDLADRFIDWVPLKANGPLELDMALLRTMILPASTNAVGEKLVVNCQAFSRKTLSQHSLQDLSRIISWAWRFDYKPGRPIIHKTPSFTMQIEPLLRLYPKAKFVYIERQPEEHISSLARVIQNFNQSFGIAPYRHDSEVDAAATRAVMLECWEQQVHLIPPGQLSCVRYEDLVRDPDGTVQSVCEDLNLTRMN